MFSLRSELKEMNAKKKEWDLNVVSMNREINALKSEKEELKSRLLQKKDDNEEKEQNEQKGDEHNEQNVNLKQVLKDWRLQRYEAILIEEFGFDDFLDWKDIGESELIEDMNFKMGHARKFVRKTKEHFNLMNDQNQQEGNEENGTPFI